MINACTLNDILKSNTVTIVSPLLVYFLTAQFLLLGAKLWRSCYFFFSFRKVRSPIMAVVAVH